MSKKNKTISDYPITTLFPDIVAKYWDYDKNVINPENVYLTTPEEFWWKGYNSSFLMPAKYLYAKSYGTSFPEQTILYFFKKNNLQVKNRHKIQYNGKKYETDIFLEDYNLAIEYDGSRWHNENIERELIKNNALEQAGIYLIRVREYGLLPTGITKGLEIFIDNENFNINIALAEGINKIFDYLETIGKQKFVRITANDIQNDKLDIYHQYLLSYDEKNINNTWLINHWSNDNEINPYLIPTNSSDKFLFNCPNHNNISLSPNFIMGISKKVPNDVLKQYEDTLLINECCPWGTHRFCPANCSSHIYDFVDCCYTPMLQQIPYQKYKEAFIKQVHSDFCIDNFIDIIYELLKYYTNETSDLLYYFIKNSTLENKSKSDVLEKVLKNANIIYAENFWRLFTNSSLVDFYLDNYSYGDIYNQWIFLDLAHSQSIYGVIKRLLKKNKFDTISLLINKIKNRISINDYSMFIFNLLSQIYAKNRWYTDEFVCNANYIELLKSHFCRDLTSEINSKIEKMFNCDKSLYTHILYRYYIKNLIDKNVFNDFYWEVLSNRVNSDTLSSIKSEVIQFAFDKSFEEQLEYECNNQSKIAPKSNNIYQSQQSTSEQDEILFSSSNFIINDIKIGNELSLNFCIENYNSKAINFITCDNGYLLQKTNITNLVIPCSRRIAKDYLEKYNATSWYNNYIDKYTFYVELWKLSAGEEFKLPNCDIRHYSLKKNNQKISPYCYRNFAFNTINGNVVNKKHLEALLFFDVDKSFSIYPYKIGVYIQRIRNKINYFTKLIYGSEIKEMLGNEYSNFYQHIPLSKEKIELLIEFIKQEKPRTIRVNGKKNKKT